jgi:hypothetical protein
MILLIPIGEKSPNFVTTVVMSVPYVIRATAEVGLGLVARDRD